MGRAKAKAAPAKRAMKTVMKSMKALKAMKNVSPKPKSAKSKAKPKPASERKAGQFKDDDPQAPKGPSDSIPGHPTEEPETSYGDLFNSPKRKTTAAKSKAKARAKAKGRAKAKATSGKRKSTGSTSSCPHRQSAQEAGSQDEDQKGSPASSPRTSRSSSRSRSRSSSSTAHSEAEERGRECQESVEKTNSLPFIIDGCEYVEEDRARAGEVKG